MSDWVNLVIVAIAFAVVVLIARRFIGRERIRRWSGRDADSPPTKIAALLAIGGAFVTTDGVVKGDLEILGDGIALLLGSGWLMIEHEIKKR